MINAKLTVVDSRNVVTIMLAATGLAMLGSTTGTLEAAGIPVKPETPENPVNVLTARKD